MGARPGRGAHHVGRRHAIAQNHTPTILSPPTTLFPPSTFDVLFCVLLAKMKVVYIVSTALTGLAAAIPLVDSTPSKTLEKRVSIYLWLTTNLIAGGMLI